MCDGRRLIGAARSQGCPEPPGAGRGMREAPKALPEPSVSDLWPPERERMRFCCLRPRLWPRQHTAGVGRAAGLGLRAVA